MKKSALILTFFIVLLSTGCDSDEINNSNIVGKWQLIETYSDPGDGSGAFHAVDSNKYLKFESNGEITSNATLCYMTSETRETQTGIYSLQDSTITGDRCGINTQSHFSLEDNYLIINYLCIEGCMEKYIKVSD